MRALALLVFWGTLAVAQTTAPPASSCLERTIAIGLIRRDKNVQPDLTGASVRAKFDGGPVEVISVSPGKGPSHAVVLVDTSGSMGSYQSHNIPTKMLMAFRTASDAVARLPATSSVAAVFFGEKEEVLGFGTDRQAIIEKLKPTPTMSMAHGQTHLRDALLHAIHLIPSPQAGDVVYVVTDGGDNGSKARETDVRHALQAAGVRLFAFIVQVSSPDTEEESFGPVTLKALAETSGGLTATFDASTMFQKDMQPKVEEAWKELYAQMSKPLMLQIRLPRPPDRLRNFKVEFVDAAGRVRRDLVLFYPRQVGPCAAP